MKNKYVSKWLLQRLTALFLIPLSFWFIYMCVSFQSFTYQEILSFFQSYINSMLFLIMMINMLIHAKLGCDTIVVDYITSTNLQKNILNAISFLTLTLLLLIIISIIKLNIIL